MTSDPSSPRATQYAVLQAAIDDLAQAGIEHPRRNAEWLLAAVLDCGRAALYAHPQRPVSAGDAQRLQQMVTRRTRHEPLQYIIGHEEFYGLRMRVTPDVLIPRPETEELVEIALQQLSDREAPRVLDVGTGSGCIALAIQHERPDATVYACDVSAEALSVARDNAQSLDLPVRFFQADMLDDAFADRAASSFDLVISNPPYIPDVEASTLPRDVRAFEPGRALFTGTDPLRFYRALARHAPALLRAGGWLALEIHAHYAEGVRTLFERPLWEGVEVHKDLADRPRIVVAQHQGAAG